VGWIVGIGGGVLLFVLFLWHSGRVFFFSGLWICEAHSLTARRATIPRGAV